MHYKQMPLNKTSRHIKSVQLTVNRETLIVTSRHTNV